MHQMHLINWLMHSAGLESLGQKHLDGHSIIGGTLRGRDTLLGELINNSMRNDLKKQQLASDNRLINATHEMTTNRLNNKELIGS